MKSVFWLIPRVHIDVYAEGGTGGRWSCCEGLNPVKLWLREKEKPHLTRVRRGFLVTPTGLVR